MDDEIKNIQESNVVVQSRQVKVNHKLIFTMVEGSLHLHAFTETTSTMKCYICGATSKQFNKIDEMIGRNKYG